MHSGSLKIFHAHCPVVLDFAQSQNSSPNCCPHGRPTNSSTVYSDDASRVLHSVVVVVVQGRFLTWELVFVDGTPPARLPQSVFHHPPEPGVEIEDRSGIGHSCEVRTEPPTRLTQIPRSVSATKATGGRYLNLTLRVSTMPLSVFGIFYGSANRISPAVPYSGSHVGPVNL